MKKIGKIRELKAVFAMVAGQSVLPLLLCIVALIAIQGGLFCTKMTQYVALGWSLEELISRTLPLPFGIVTILLWFGITEIHTSGKSNIEYTMKRLGISQDKMAFVWFLTILLCLIIFWVVEMMILVGLSQLYLHQLAPELYNQQTLFLTTYRSDFFHRFLPLHDLMEWAQLGVGLITLALGSVYCVVWHWNGKNGSVPAIIFLVIFVRDMLAPYSNYYILTPISLIFGFMFIVMILGVQNDED